MIDALEVTDWELYNRYVRKSQNLEHRINATLKGYGLDDCR